MLVRILLLVPLVTALFVILGWFIQYAPFIQVLPQFVPMQFNTALCFLLVTVAAYCFGFNWRIPALICSSLTILISFLTILEYVFDLHLGINELFFKHYITTKNSYPGRIAPTTAISFCLLGIGVLILAAGRSEQKRWIAAVLAAVVFPIAVAALVAYLAQIQPGYSWLEMTYMAVHTATSFTFLSIAIYIQAWSYNHCGRPSKWVIMPLGLTSLLSVFALRRLLDVHFVSTDVAGKEIEAHVLIVIVGTLLAIVGIYVFKKSVEYTQRLEVVNQLFRQRSREREMLLYYLNEEVRAPLSAVLNYVVLIQEETPSVVANRAQAAALQMRHVLEDLVVVMQEKERGPVAVFKETNFEDLYEPLIKVFQEEAEHRKLHFEHVVEGTRVANISIDKEKVYHVISFLLHAAFLRTPEGGVVSFSISFIPSAIKVSICDSAGNIDLQQQKRLLSVQPFEREGKIDRMQLGAFVCNKLLHAMDSELHLEVVIDRGTEFSFIISI